MRCGSAISELSPQRDLQTDAPAVIVFERRGNNRSEIESIELADAAKRILDALLFRFQLSIVTDMLPRAAAASADIGAGRRLSHRRRFYDANRFADGITLFRFCYSSFD